MITLQILAASLIHFSLKGWEIVLFELGSERVHAAADHSGCGTRAQLVPVGVKGVLVQFAPE